MAKVGRLVKDLLIKELSDALQQRPAFFVTTVQGLPATDADTLRKQLYGMQSRMVMIKRTLGLRGLSALNLSGASELLAGSVALVLPGEDMFPAAKLLVEFAKASADKLVIRGAWVDGQLLDKQRLEEFANLPPKPQLIAQVIGGVESPMAGLVLTIEKRSRENGYKIEKRCFFPGRSAGVVCVSHVCARAAGKFIQCSGRTGYTQI